MLNLVKKKEKNKTLWRSRQRYCLGFWFGDQDTIEGVITFRIDCRTIKRGILWLSGYQVPLGVIVHVHCSSVFVEFLNRLFTPL